MRKKSRFTSKMEQELISRQQLTERFIQFGWIPNPPVIDLGEDFIVNVYFQGSGTGISFYIQEKSVTNIEGRLKNDYVVYPFAVKDLLHWEKFGLPVVLIVWDIKLKEGRWAILDDATKYLDEKRPRWRSNKTTTQVFVPWENATDDKGLKTLRHIIGLKLLPIISKGEPIAITPQFPDTVEGEEARKIIERISITGGKAVLSGTFFDYPEWFETENVQVVVKAELPSIEIPTRIYITNHDSKTISRETELKLFERNVGFLRFSDEHQSRALTTQLTVRENPSGGIEFSFNIRVNNLGVDAYEARDVMKFVKSLAEGGILRLYFPTLENQSIVINAPYQPENFPYPKPEYMRFLDTLCLIQDNVKEVFQVPIEGPSSEDLRAINSLINIIRTGKLRGKADHFEIEIRKPGVQILLNVHRLGKQQHARIITPTSSVKLFGKEILTGHVTQHIIGSVGISIDEFEAAVENLCAGESLLVRIVDVEVTEVYSDWFLKEAQRLSKTLIERFQANAVYMFGPLVWSDVHEIDTAIDLAVDGLAPDTLINAIDHLREISNYPINLVNVNEVQIELKEKIEKDGKLLG
jgi:predicted nucleotidyltransferase